MMNGGVESRSGMRTPGGRWRRGVSGAAVTAVLVHAPLGAQTAAIVRAAAGLTSPPVVTAPATLPVVAPVAPNVAGMTSASARAIANQAAVANATNLAAQANAAARATAQALASSVANGLTIGGLVPVANPTTAALDPTGLRTWQGASQPVQSGAAGTPTVTITQTDPRALLTWESFNIGKTTTLVFKQAATDVVVNRVVGNIDPVTGRLSDIASLRPSQILGAIKADGTVVVINQNGVMFSGTAQVDTRSFLVSSLELGGRSRIDQTGQTVATTLQDRGVTFLQNGLLSGSQLISAVGIQAGLAVADPATPEGTISVATGAAITSASGGYVIIAAPQVINAGQLSATEGQVSLQSGRQVTATASSGASDSADPGIRGLVLSSLGSTPDSVTNTATGLITVPRGYASLGATLGGSVTDAGVIASTTSVSRNGKVSLTGGTVSVAPGATIAITPDANSEAIPQGADSVAAFKHSQIVIGGSDSRGGVVSPAQIVIGSGALIYAPSADVTIGATNDAAVATIDRGQVAPPSSVLIDSGATIDVGGIKDFLVPASRNSIQITPVKRNELRDTPNYREATTDGSFTLNGATVFVDPRLSGVRSDGVAWIGSPLIEAGSYFAQVGVTAAELMTTGGNLTLGARSYAQGSTQAVPSVRVRSGATLDISGGWVRYEAGTVQTTRLLTADGRIVEIGKADPNDNFVGIVGVTTATQDRFGFSQSFANPALQEFGFEPGYTEGRDAGSLTVKASTDALAGTLHADAFAGTQQIARAKEGSAKATIVRDLRTLQSAPSELPSGGLFKVAAFGTTANTLAGGADIIVYHASDAAPARPASEILLPDALLSGSGLSGVTLQTSGRVSFLAGSALALQPNGALVVDAGRSIRFDGSVSVPSGTIAARTYEIAIGSVFTAADDLPTLLAADAATPRLFDITVGGTLSARGLWTNDALVADGAYLGGAFTDGGSISLQVAPRVLQAVAGGTAAADLSGSIFINAGARVDVSGGGYVKPDGSLLLASRGGNVALINETTYFQIAAQGPVTPGQSGRVLAIDAPGFITTATADRQSGLTPRALESQVAIAPGTIAGQGFAGGGTFTLVTPDLNFGARAGATGTALALDFFSSTGFGSYALTTNTTRLLPNVFANGLVGNTALLATETATVGAGETLTLTQALIPSLLDSGQIAAVRGLASGGDIGGLLGTAVPADAWDRKAVNLTLGGLTELDVLAGGTVTGSDGAVLTAAKIYNAGTVRIAGGTLRQSATLPSAYAGGSAIGVASLSQVFGTADANGLFDENAPNALGITRSQEQGSPVLSNADLTTLGGLSRPVYLTATLGAAEGIRLAPGSTTDLSGASIRNPRAGARPNGGDQKISGRVVAGGTIETAAAFAGNTAFAPLPAFGIARYAIPDGAGGQFTVPTQRAGWTLVAGANATVDLRGAADRYDQEVALGVFQPGDVWSSGGRLTLGAGGSLNGARIFAAGGAAQAEGGVLTWLDPVLTQADTAGLAANVVAADQIMAAGFDTFVAQDRLASLGDAALRLDRGFYLVARPYTGNPANLDLYRANLAATGTVRIDAPYIHLESALQSVVPLIDAAPGTGQLTLAGQTIDIVGAVYAEQSIAALTLVASGDVRLTGVQPPALVLAPSGNAAIPGSLAGQLVVGGDLAITAAQIYPTTGTGSLQQDVNAVRAGTVATAVPFVIASTGTDATIRFARASSAVPGTPFAAGGNLLVQAAHIRQDGVLRAPLGRLVLGSNDPLVLRPNEVVSQTVPATASVTLGAGSVTSVSAAGLNIPYGTTTDLIEYFFTPTSDGRLFAPPAAELRLAGDAVDVLPGATVDASGGGDLYAYEFVPGVGGSHDVLNRFNTDAFSSRNGLQFPDGRQVYAIVPSLGDAGAAPVDPIYSADYGNLYSATDAGRRVYLEAAPGLTAGWYTLLPARYALLPGGFRVVENVGAAPPALGQSAQLRDGSLIVGGHYGVAGTAIEASDRRTFTVQNQATFRKFSNLQTTSATTTFGNLATRDGLTVPRLPIDAARLVLNPLSELGIGTKFLTTPAAGGRGAQVDISGTAFEILAPGGTASGNAITLTTTDVANLDAASLLIGGVRTDRADGSTAILATTHAITVATNAANPLTAPEIVMVVDGVDSTITVADGAAIIATGALADTRSGNYVITASAATGQTATGAILRVANGPERLISRPGDLAAANSLDQTSLSIGEATLTGSAVLLDSSRDLIITDNLLTPDAKPLITATTLALGGDDIFFTAAPSGYRGLVVTPDLEAQFGAAQRLTVTSPSIVGFAAGTHTFNDLVIDARGIRPYGQAVTPPPAPRQDQVDVPAADLAAPIVVTLDTRDFSFGNSNAARGACTDTTTVTACGTTGNSLIVNATAVHLGTGAMATFGFDQAVTFNAAQGVFIEGAGTLDIGKADFRATTPYFGDRALVADPRGAKVQPSFALSTSGAVSLAGTGAAAAAVAAAPGATLRFGDIGAPVAAFSADGLTLRATAGVLDVRSEGSVTVTGNAVLATPGYAKTFGDGADPVTLSSPGGALTLVSLAGDVALGSNTTLSIGGGQGEAGALLLSAAQGKVVLPGHLDASAPGGRAAFALNSGTAAFDLPGFLAGAGKPFTGAIAIRTGTGDLTLGAGQTLTATSLRLTADGGLVDIAGTVDTSGVNGGAIGLFGTGGVALRATALLDASADGYGATDTRAATGGRVEIGTAGTGTITVDAGAVIDVSARRPGARLVAQIAKDPVTLNDRTTYAYAQSDTGGSVAFRAPATGADGAESVAITYRGVIKGASDVSVEGYRSYDLQALARADCAAADICINAAGQAVLDVNASPGTNRLSSLVDGGIPQFVRRFDISASATGLGALVNDPNFHARPGIELDYAGDIVLASNWNLAAGTVDEARAKADKLLLASPQLGNGLFYVAAGREGDLLENYTDFTYRTGGKASGEAGVLTLRAGGNLDIRGSITDGFFTFADQTDPAYISFQLGGGDRKYRPALDLSCGVGGSCSALTTQFEFVPGARGLPFPSTDIITISAAKLLRGQDAADVFGAPLAPYNPLANTAGALGAQANGAGDPIGSAALLPLLADGTAAASTSFRLVGGAASGADPLSVAPSSAGTVSISGEQSYRAAPVNTPQSYGGALQLAAFDPNLGNIVVAPGAFIAGYTDLGFEFDPALYTRLTLTGASPAARTYLVTAARSYFAANGIADDQYQFFGPVNNPNSLTASIGLLTGYLQSIASDFGARAAAGQFGYAAPTYRSPPTTLINATIFTRSLVRTGTGSIDVAAASDVDLTNGRAVFRGPTDRPVSNGATSGAQVGGAAIYTAGHAVAAAPQAATVAGTGAQLTVDPAYAAGNLLRADFRPNSQGVLASPPVYATGGGGITVAAGRDVLARRDAWAEKYRGTESTGNPPPRYTNAGTDTQLWRVAGDGGTALPDGVLSTNLRINPQLFSTGVGALGGGSVAVTAGRNVSQLTAVADTSVLTGQVLDPAAPGAPTSITYGGGNVSVTAGGSLFGSQIDVASGTASIASGGAVASAGLLRLAGSVASPVAALEANLLRLRVGNATADVTAVQSIAVGAIASTDGLGDYAPVSGVSFRTNGGFTLANRGKDVLSGVASTSVADVAVLPGSLSVAALFGNIDLSAGAVTAGAQQTQVVLYPSPSGQLRLFAGGDFAAVTLSMDDSDPSLTPFGNFTFPSILPSTDDNARRRLHNQRITHAGDSNPAYIYAQGNIDGLTLALPKQGRISAGGDITDMIFVGQNLAATDVTRITAGRDIVATSRVLSVGTTATGLASLPVLQGNTFILGGPGALFVEAGRDLGPFLNSAVVRNAAGSNVAYAGGIVTVGNDYNPWLGAAGARVYAEFGVGKGADYNGLRDTYVDPANTAALDGDLFAQIVDANGNRSPDRTKPIYAPILIDWLAANTGVTYPNATAAYAAFVALPALVQRQFLLDKVYFNELAAPSRPDGPSYLQYIRGYRAVDRLFPAVLGYTANDLSGAGNGGTKVATGNLDLRLATLETQRGGDITILGPGGRVLGGSVVATSAQAARRGEEVGTFNLFQGLRRVDLQVAERITGIPIGFEGVLTLRGGFVNGFTDGDFLLNQSRLFTIDGGDVTLWSSNGDLNAGQGAKTSASNPPVVLRFNPDGFGFLDQAGSVAGAGIAALLPSTSGVPAPSVTLIAPVGTVDAGDAGVRAAGTVFVAAAQVANADNFKAGGGTSGIGGAAAVDLGAAASANAASAAAQQAAAAVNPTGNRSDDDRSRISVDVLGFGGDPKDDPCAKPVDQRPTNCPVTRP